MVFTIDTINFCILHIIKRCKILGFKQPYTYFWQFYLKLGNQLKLNLTFFWFTKAILPLYIGWYTFVPCCSKSYFYARHQDRVNIIEVKTSRYLLSEKSASKGGREGFEKSQQKTDFLILTASLNS